MRADVEFIELTADSAFRRTDDGLHPVRLCGMPIGPPDGVSGPVLTRGIALLSADGRRYEADDLRPEDVVASGHEVTCSWLVGGTPLRLVTAWEGNPATGIVRRRDSLTNAGEESVTLSRCLARVAFPPGRYECYTQFGRWCHENQGGWLPLHTGLRLTHLPGRTTEGSTPYLGLRPVGADQGIAFHLLPLGNWTLRVNPVPSMGELPFAVIELGLADEDLHRVVSPGATIELPEILFQPLPQGEPHLAAPSLHRHLLRYDFAEAKPEAPVVYNTWFDQFPVLDVPRLRSQLAAAREIGCDVFVVDAGWYGAGGSDWAAQTGDWREKTDAAFRGHMGAFADEVRAAGLGFGLWMEPQRFGREAPIRAKHPEWFIPVGEHALMDLAQPAAHAWLRSEISRLVETYDLAWMKIDFNFSLDADASGSEMYDYGATWFQLLDELRNAYPNTFFEGCSSGAMCGDLETLRHFDGHFLSDTTNPTDVLRISQGAWLRLPPGRITRWAVVRSVEGTLPEYPRSIGDSPPAVLAPGGALWDPAERVDLGFALLAVMPGMLGFSGDLAGLTPDQRRQAAESVAFYKRWRRFIVGAVGHLLTPPMPMDCREGWIGFQLQRPDGDVSLVFLFRLGNAGAPPPLRLYGLDPRKTYAVQRGPEERSASECTRCRGELLMAGGWPLGQPAMANGSARLFVIQAV